MKKYIHTIIIAFISILLITSCSEDPELVRVAPEQVMERIDMVLESNDREYVYKQSQQEDATEDLVLYNFYGNTANKIDFKIQLSEQKTLIVQLMHKRLTRPWEYENSSYAIYPTQEEDDKEQFVRVVMETNNEGTNNYVSNYNHDFPNQPNLNAFTIVEFNLAKSEMLCRINDITIVPENGNQEEAITLNGTFRGAITFM